MRSDTQVLFETYRQNVYAAAFSVCKNAADAEDILQETFLQYHQTNKQFDSEQHIRAWLLRVALNRAKDVYRKRKRRNETPLEDYMETLTFPSPESGALFSAVMALPEHYRSVIHLFYYEDYTIDEIAKLLHLTQSNVKVRLSRGRKLLKESLGEDWNDDE
ncbi:MAG: RNA polymerase sigma factor [Clostridia bacterium]|jgi:RNA polymerase sigma-70 factor (ECF subfamily)|nr:RNA polymerase sigma factor [Clostridia bacterium]